MFALILMSTILALWFFNKYVSFQKYIKQLDVFPQFKGLPIIGSIYKFYNANTSLEVAYELYKECGTSYVVYMAYLPHLVVCDPELTKVIISSKQLIDKGISYNFLKAWMGDGLLLSTGNKWKNHREVLQSSFRYAVLEDFVHVFDKISKVFIQQLETLVDSNNTSVDIYQYCTLCTFDIICESAMGIEVNIQENPNLSLVQSMKDICYTMFLRFVTPLRFDWIFYLTKYYTTQKQAIKVLHNFSNTIIQQRRRVLENKETLNLVDEYGIKTKHNLLDLLLQATVNNRKLTDEEIRNEVDTFLFEGHHTTAIALSITIYLLSKHQDVQQKVFEEIVRVIGPDKKKSVTMDELQQLKYTDMVIKEALRLYPSVSIFRRHLNKDISYKNGFIPRGIEVVFNIFALHRNADAFPDPEKFDPERFSPENIAKRHPYAYIPFSAGPRNCIGQKFAMLELRSILSKLLRYFVVLPTTSDYIPKVTCQLNLQLTEGIHVELTRRC